ncbi:MAG: S46 family peptidase, partial [Bacteroidaceae bacterium]|nr:S46 family peptidase [Bacteroidaceae bacterium]
MKKLLVTLLAIMSILPIKADEGMWMLTDLKKQNEVVMRQLGLDLSVDEIYSPDNISLKDAVIHFGSGCTGEVISAEGLVITNHHCGYSAIQQQSSVEHDYLTDGFWARSKAEELPIRGLTITFIDKILDVTDYVMEQLKKDPDPQGTNFLSPSYLQQ